MPNHALGAPGIRAGALVPGAPASRLAGRRRAIRLGNHRQAERAAEAVSRRLLVWLCRAAIRRAARARMLGLANLPPDGPAILACRHYPYLYDGAALVALLPRPLSILIALDWVRGAGARKLLAAACAAAGFPAVLREHPAPATALAAERMAFLRRSARLAVSVLREGRVLVVFPEGYPTIDPVYTPKVDRHQILAYQSGFLNLAAMCRRAWGAPVPIIPVGLHYSKGRPRSLTIRFGAPLYLEPGGNRGELLRQVEEQVRVLSRQP